MVCLFINYLRGVIFLIEIIDLRRNGVCCKVKMAQYLGNGDRVEYHHPPKFLFLGNQCLSIERYFVISIENIAFLILKSESSSLSTLDRF